MFLKWFLLKCSRSLAVCPFLIAVMFLPPAAYSSPSRQIQPALKKQELPKELQEVEALYSKSATLSADFSQLNDDVVLSKKKKSSGKIFVKRPSKVRWETTQPDTSLFVSDGIHSWFYTPPFDEGERGQLIERKASEVQSRLTQSLLSGSFSIAKDMTILQKSSSTFLLVPPKGTAGSVTEAQIEIDPDKHLIQKVILKHAGGNLTEIALSKIQLGVPLQDSVFVFQAPPNTDRIDQGTKSK